MVDISQYQYLILASVAIIRKLFIVVLGSANVSLLLIILSAAHLSATRADEINFDVLKQPCKEGNSFENYTFDSATVGGEKKSLYGDDDRIELIDAGSKYQQAAKSVAALVQRSRFSGTGSTPINWYLPINKTLQDHGWCQDEPFSQQPSLAYCTGFLVEPDLMATSGHCVKSVGGEEGVVCEEISIVFDFAVKKDATVKNSFTEKQVYRCVQVMSRSDDESDADWAIIKLDRKVEDRIPLKLYKSGRAFPENIKLSVIGHPLGLPAKVSLNGEIINQSISDYIVSAIDTYAGNSGSPVFWDSQRSQTLVVVGILSQGAPDRTPSIMQGENGNEITCYRSWRCEGSSCQGEYVTRASELPEYSSIESFVKLGRRANAGVDAR